MVASRASALGPVAAIVAALAGCGRPASLPPSLPAAPPADDRCWALLPVDRVRVFPRAGAEGAMVGGTIQGSHEGPTNGFTVLATLSAAPAAGQWTELAFANAVPYRYVKYCGPPGSYGQVAELEFYGGGARLAGAGFGTTGPTANPWENALDGDLSTWFSAPTPSDAYVGLDAGAGHVVATPGITPAGGSFPGPVLVSLSTATPGATLRYTTDASDPAADGRTYSGPFTLGATATVRAVASAPCLLDSPAATAVFSIGTAPDTPSRSHSTLHVGNSLTDTIDGGFLIAVAAAGAVDLDYARYTVPGAGTWVFQDMPTGGFGVEDVRAFVAATARDHVTFQPFPNMPCLPTGGEPTPGQRASDTANVDEAWDMALPLNPAVRMWIYEAWPPTPSEGFLNCITGGAWLRDPTIWSPPAPATWEEAEANQLLYAERVRAALLALHPERPEPLVVPAGRALARLKAAVEAGSVEGVAQGAFWSTYFSEGGTDNHLTAPGRYLVALVFYASLFQADPRALPDTGLGTRAVVTAAQAAAYQQIAWDAVTTYPLSGWAR